MAGAKTYNELPTFTGPATFSSTATFGGTGTFSAGASSTVYAATGITGATAASRYAGATSGGPPVSGTFSTGDFVNDNTGPFWVCTSGGAPGTWYPLAGNTELYKEPFITNSTTPPIAVTSYRCNGSATVSPGSGTAMFNSVPLVKGQVITNLSLLSLGGETGGSHAWVALADTGAVVRAVSTDGTAATFWGSNTAKTLALSTGGPYTVPSTGLYFCVFGMTASGMATFVGGPNLSTGEAAWGSGQPACGTAGSFGAPPSTAATLTLSGVAAANLKFILT